MPQYSQPAPGQPAQYSQPAPGQPGAPPSQVSGALSVSLKESHTVKGSKYLILLSLHSVSLVALLHKYLVPLLHKYLVPLLHKYLVLGLFFNFPHIGRPTTAVYSCPRPTWNSSRCLYFLCNISLCKASNHLIRLSLECHYRNPAKRLLVFNCFFSRSLLKGQQPPPVAPGQQPGAPPPAQGQPPSPYGTPPPGSNIVLL